MKFRFMGDGDCPDWVLSTLSSVTAMSSLKFKIFAKNVVDGILDNKVNEEKFMKGDQDLDLQKTSYECVRFLILSAVRHNTDSNTFNIEIQQIGVPKEHSSALCKVMEENSVKLRKYLESQTLKINQLEDVKVIPSTAVDCIQLELKINNEIVDGVSRNVTHNLNIQKDDVKVLLKELKTIRSTMDNLDFENKHSQ